MDLNQILVLAVQRKSYIIHLVGGSPPLGKTFEGPLIPLTNEILSVAEVKNLLESTLTPEQKQHLFEHKELNTAVSVEGFNRFRTTLFYQRGSVAGIFRLTPPNPPTLDQLGMPSVLKEEAVKPQGLILIVAPKGSGKSMILAALLNHLLEARSLQIVSLENPIEFLLKNKKGVIYQREVGTDVATFAQGVKTALRQSPDVLVLTELSDPDTITSVLSAAASGQLVIATVAANGVIMALEQIIDIAPPHFQQPLRGMLANSLELAISQLLLWKKEGGLIPALEIMVGSANAKSVIREGKLQQLVQVMNNGRDMGMITQEFALKNLLKKNLIELEEAMSKAVRPEELRRLAALPI